MNALDWLGIASSIAVGMLFGGFLAGWALTRQVRILALELLAHPKVGQLIRLGERALGSGGKQTFGSMAMGLASQYLGGLIGGGGPPPGSPPP